ncbi:ABC transporter substrate-binding protein [Mesorhizobium sp. CCNWLW179-1]|uniref:ABC transporter substrate-binding protein n=1 Tax=unclassified Mesorhizobium TaxID=325217 RepID=UPI0030157B3E
MKARNLLTSTLAALALALSSSGASQAQTRGVTDTEVIIGSAGDLSGPAANNGLASAHAMQLRVDEINAAGGIHGRKLRLIVEDAQYQVPRAVQAANKLINRDKIFAMIGTVGTPQNNAVFPLLEQNNIPSLFPLSQARVMWSPVNKLKFQFNADYRDQVGGAVKYMVDQKKTKFCAEYQDTDFGKDIVTGAEEELKKAGLSIVAKSTHKPTDTDLGTQMINLRKAGCEVVVLGTLGRDAIIAYTTARRAGWTDVEFIGVSPTYDPAVSGVPDGGTDGLYASTGVWIKPREEMPEAGRQMFDKYKAAYGSEPTVSAMISYIGIDLIAVALEKAGKDVTTESFLAALESIKDYNDAFGNPPQNYSADNHQGSNAAFVTRVKGGAYELIAGPISHTD